MCASFAKDVTHVQAKDDDYPAGPGPPHAGDSFKRQPAALGPLRRRTVPRAEGRPRHRSGARARRHRDDAFNRSHPRLEARHRGGVHARVPGRGRSALRQAVRSDHGRHRPPRPPLGRPGARGDCRRRAVHTGREDPLPAGGDGAGDAHARLASPGPPQRTVDGVDADSVGRAHDAAGGPRHRGGVRRGDALAPTGPMEADACSVPAPIGPACDPDFGRRRAGPVPTTGAAAGRFLP